MLSICLSSQQLVSRAYFLPLPHPTPWPNLAHTLSPKCFCVKDGHWPWTKSLGQRLSMSKQTSVLNPCPCIVYSPPPPPPRHILPHTSPTEWLYIECMYSDLKVSVSKVKIISDLFEKSLSEHNVFSPLPYLAHAPHNECLWINGEPWDIWRGEMLGHSRFIWKQVLYVS